MKNKLPSIPTHKKEKLHFWTLKYGGDVPTDLEKEVQCMRERLDQLKITPRDPDSYELWMICLIKTIFGSIECLSMSRTTLLI
jgi:hypothetical protein